MVKVELNNKLAQYKVIEAALKKLESEKKALREEIVKEFNKKTTLSTKDFVATYTKSIRNILDTSAIKADGLFDKYKKESEVFTLSVTKKE